MYMPDMKTYNERHYPVWILSQAVILVGITNWLYREDMMSFSFVFDVFEYFFTFLAVQKLQRKQIKDNSSMTETSKNL